MDASNPKLLLFLCDSSVVRDCLDVMHENSSSAWNTFECLPAHNHAAFGKCMIFAEMALDFSIDSLTGNLDSILSLERMSVSVGGDVSMNMLPESELLFVKKTLSDYAEYKKINDNLQHLILLQKYAQLEIDLVSDVVARHPSLTGLPNYETFCNLKDQFIACTKSMSCKAARYLKDSQP